MLAKFSSIRYMYIRSHLYALFLMTILQLSFLLTIHAVFKPNWLTTEAIFLFVLPYLFFGFLVSIYAGFESSGNLKQRIDYLSVQITQYANGNYLSRIHMNEQDEITIIARDLNLLGEKLQNQVKSLQRMAEEKTEYAQSAYKTATLEERQRLARELHDSVSQQLFALTMMTEAALNQFEKDPEKAKLQLKEIAKIGLTAQTEMRALLLHLRPVYLSGESLQKGIEHLVKDIQQQTNLDIELSIEKEISASETIEENVFRIVQEALSNILRHSEAIKATIDMRTKAQELLLYIRDNGKGFKQEVVSSPKTSYGLHSMKERVENLGGTFRLHSKENQGTYLDIRIPM